MYLLRIGYLLPLIQLQEGFRSVNIIREDSCHSIFMQPGLHYQEGGGQIREKYYL